MDQPPANNRNMLLNANEKAHVKQVCNHLIFESGICVTARKYSKLTQIYGYMKSVFDQKCREVDISNNEYLEFLPHIPTRSCNKPLMKTSLLYDTFTGETIYKGSTLWNSFKASKAELINVWMPNYKLTSGDTVDNDEKAVLRMLPYVWLFGKNKSLAAARNRAARKSKKDDTDDAKPVPDAHLDDYPQRAFFTVLLLTFQMFKSNNFISRPVGGTAAEAVSLLEDEDANPLWDVVCKNQKTQRKLGRRRGESALAKRRREGAEDVTARNKARMYRHKQKEKNLKGLKKSLDTANMLELAKLYHSMGDTKKTKEIMCSTLHSEMVKPVDVVELSSSSESDSSEVEALSSEPGEVEASVTPTTGSTASASASATVPDSDLDMEAGSQE
jgi:hypothetical protein